MASKQEIIVKVKKLLALANNNSSINEAQAAALKAQALMLKYNLEQEELREAGQASTDNIATEKVMFTDRKRQWHHVRLGGIIAKNFRCKTYFSTYSVTFIGFEQDAKAAAEVFRFICDALETCFKVFLKEDKKADPWKYHGMGPAFSKRIKRNYIEGFIEGLREAFENRVKESEKYALMVVTPALVESHFNSLMLKPASHQERHEPLDSTAVMVGYADGKRVLSKRELEG